MPNTITLYRPVGAQELALIVAAGYRAFPPRLPSQPIFYPVLNEAYAVKIARDWNTKDAASGFTGFVTRFAVDAAFVGATRFEPPVHVGTRNSGSWPKTWRNSTVTSSARSRSWPSSEAITQLPPRLSRRRDR